MASHNEFGRAAEEAAAAFLECNGWTILARNWRSGRREIDVIVRRGGTVAFVEVKARHSRERGHPLEAIGWRKQRDLAIAARAWIERHGGVRDEYRFDAVHVVPGGRGGLEVVHTEHAWWDAGPSG
jgi:putative endonuclease